MTGVDLTEAVRIRDSLGNRAIIPHQPTPIPLYGTILTSMFMHGGISHIFGNMLFLWVFGDNLENRLGHLRFLVFYLLCGAIAALAQIFTDPNSIIPMLGASGAISGVLGGYLLLFPRRSVTALIFFAVVQIPAFVALGFWIGFQILQNYWSSGTGGVAYMAHIGGFIAGFALIKIFALGTEKKI